MFDEIKTMPKLYFSKAMVLAGLNAAVVVCSAVLLYHTFWSYTFGRATLAHLVLFFILLAWGVVTIMGCFLYDRSITRQLMAHHAEALTSNEGRPSAQPE